MGPKQGEIALPSKEILAIALIAIFVIILMIIFTNLRGILR